MVKQLILTHSWLNSRRLKEGVNALGKGISNRVASSNYISSSHITRVSCLQEELVSLRLQCSSVYRKGHFSQALGNTGAERPSQISTDSGLTLGQTLLGAVGAVGAVSAALLRRPTARSQLVAMSSSEDEGSLRFIYELLGWVEETQVSHCSS